MSTNKELRIELQRKLIHLSSLWIPSVFYLIPEYISRHNATILFGLIFCLLIVFDYWRYCYSHLLPVAWKSILREQEQNRFRLTGASWMLLASTLTMLIFPHFSGFVAMSILVISDTCAALIGKRWGSIAVLGKSLQGSLAFFLTAYACTLFGVWLFDESEKWLLFALIPALVSTLVELISKKIRIDDNLSIPLATAFTVWLVSYASV